ncbi:MAG: polyprenyl synthetase family protein [Anaerolineales bacterium]|nr:polyprenyl synthetase family protein [Anaerolineales bacterium]
MPVLDIRLILAHIRLCCLALCQQEWLALAEIADALLPDPLDPIALIPIATGCASGSPPIDDLEQAAAALLLVSLSLRIADDCADQDNPNALYQEIGLGRAVNAALAFNAIGAREFSHHNQITGFYNHAFLQVCRGQDADIAQFVDSLADYEQIVRHKTVAAYEFAAALGAHIATTDPAIIARCSQCGVHLGWMAQILDDIETLWFPETESPTEFKKTAFPILLGLSIDHPNAKLLGEIIHTQEYDRTRICELLDDMDVRARLIHTALDHRDAALTTLRGAPHPEGADILNLWLNWLLRDAARLIEE